MNVTVIRRSSDRQQAIWRFCWELPGMDRSDVFFLVCVGAFGTAFLTLF